MISEYLGQVRAKGVRALILGCTHYPLLKSALSRFLGEGTALVDSAEATAEEVGRVLRTRSLVSLRQERDNRYVRWLTLPGLWLQEITTQEPDDAQMEVAIVALKSALEET